MKEGEGVGEERRRKQMEVKSVCSGGDSCTVCIALCSFSEENNFDISGH